MLYDLKTWLADSYPPYLQQWESFLTLTLEWMIYEIFFFLSQLFTCEGVGLQRNVIVFVDLDRN